MGVSGFGDSGDYQGHLVAVNLSTGATTVWNSECANIHRLIAPGECPDTQGALWGRGTPVQDPLTGNILVVTGDGAFRGDGLSYGDSVIELTPDLSRVVDSYTPANYAELDAKDQDLGSTDPAILPMQAGSKTPYLMVQGGKDNNLRLINRQNLSGMGGPNHAGGEVATIGVALPGDINTQPAVWTDSSGVTWVFVTNFGGLMAYKVVTTDGNTTLQLAYQSTNYARASSPFIANGILYLQRSNLLSALDPTTGTVLWSSTTIGSIHWQSPVVVNGHVYVLDGNSHLTDYSTTGSAPPSTPTPTPTPGSCSGTFAQNVVNSGSSSVVPWFEPCGWTAGYVILHYTVPGLPPQNVNMTYNSSTTRWEYTVNGLSSGQTLTYSFSYQQNGFQNDTGSYTWTQP